MRLTHKNGSNPLIEQVGLQKMKPIVITTLFATAAILMAFQSVADPLSPLEARDGAIVNVAGEVTVNYREDPSASFGDHEGLPWGLTVSRNAIHSLDEGA